MRKESKRLKFALLELSSLLGCFGGGLSGGFLVLFSVKVFPMPAGGLPPVYWLPLAMTASLCALAGAFCSTLAAAGICLAQLQGLLPRQWAFRKPHLVLHDSPEKPNDWQAIFDSSGDKAGKAASEVVR